MITDNQKIAVEFCENILEVTFDGDINDFEQVSKFLFEHLKDAKAISIEEFNIVVQVMGLLRCGRISTLTPNCEVREILLADKIK